MRRERPLSVSFPAFEHNGSGSSLGVRRKRRVFVGGEYPYVTGFPKKRCLAKHHAKLGQSIKSLKAERGS